MLELPIMSVICAQNECSNSKSRLYSDSAPWFWWARKDCIAADVCKLSLTGDANGSGPIAYECAGAEEV
jgi:hypothetical protein